MMTAFVAMIGLVPLALGAGETGKELLHPLAIVVIGGLLDSTLMDQIVTPAVFFLFGQLYISWFGRNPYLNEEGGSSAEEGTQRWADLLFPPTLAATNGSIESKLPASSEHSTPLGGSVAPGSSSKEVSR